MCFPSRFAYKIPAVGTEYACTMLENPAQKDHAARRTPRAGTNSVTMKTKIEPSFKRNVTQSGKPAAQIPHEEIAQRARAIYEESGCIPGQDLQNWLAAETQLRAARKKRHLSLAVEP